MAMQQVQPRLTQYGRAGHSSEQGKGVARAPCVITEEQSGSHVPGETS